MKNNKNFLGLFALVSIMYIIGLISGYEILKFIFKPLIILSLLLYYIKSVKRKSKLFIGAVLFSFLGDVLLLYDTELFFMLGLVSFLLAHILFISMVVGMLKTSTLKQKIIVIIPFLGTYMGLLFLLKDSLGELLIPVVIYGLVISVFGVVSLLNHLISKSNTSQYLLFGAVFFVVSDSLLAINKFYESQEYYPVIVIITYILAQYLICKSVILNSEE
ncbi:MAG: lysoplasmalogenase [Urechidicola sp.]|nr:lysoplasmalogenase [Urechidicola sp.]